MDTETKLKEATQQLAEIARLAYEKGAPHDDVVNQVKYLFDLLG